MTKLEARPKGSMCLGCVHVMHMCDHLMFDQMPIIGRDDDGRAVAMLAGCEPTPSSQQRQMAQDVAIPTLTQKRITTVRR